MAFTVRKKAFVVALLALVVCLVLPVWASAEESASVSGDPLSQLMELHEPGLEQGVLVALIDTGVSDDSNAVGTVCTIDSDPFDANGHGTQMLQTILEQNPEAKVLSVKALNADGNGTVASVYDAIVYAMDAGADIINLSFSAYAPYGNADIEAVIGQAQARGVRVVASAGNQNADASAFVPASIPGVITVGALGANGHKQALSNYGECVDVWVQAESTSEAAAMISGWLSTRGPDAALEACEFACFEAPLLEDEEGSTGGIGDNPSPQQGSPGEVASGSGAHYTISFDPHGGRGQMPDEQAVVELGGNYNSVLPSCTFSREGYRFAGWKTVVPDNGVENVAPVIVPDRQALHNLSYEVERNGEPWVLTLASYADEGRILLRAVWEDESTGVIEDIDDVTDDGMKLEFSVDTSSTSYKTLYMYVYAGKSAYLSFTASSSQSVNGYTFTNRQSLLTVPTSSSTAFYGFYSPYDKWAWCWGPLKERNNLVAAGWVAGGVTFYSDDAHGIPCYRYYNSSNGGHLFSTSASLSGWIKESDVVAYGLKFYKVAFAGNGSTSGSMSTQTYQWGITYTLPGNGFSRTGYSFNGWSGSNGGNYSNAQKVSNLTSTSGGTVTLSAKWAANAYSIVFDPNGGQGVVGDMPATYDAAVELPSNSFSRAGYRFAGWNTAADGSGDSYQEGQSVKNLSSQKGAVVTLYAQWEPLQLEFSIPTELAFNLYADGRLELAGDSSAIANEGDAGIVIAGMRASASSGLAVTNESPQLGEYALSLGVAGFGEFDLADYVGDEFRAPLGASKWTIDAKAARVLSGASGMCGGITDESLRGGQLGTIEWLVALDCVTVSYDSNGGEGSMDSQLVNAGVAFAAPSCGFSQAGKKFTGWNTQSDGGGKAYLTGEVFSCTADTVLYAQWV